MADEKQGDNSLSSQKLRKKHKLSLGRQCAAWGCNSRGLKEQEVRNPVSSGIAFFKFPDNKNQKKVWCSRIKRVDGKDGFNVNQNTRLCEKHFKPEDITRAPGGTRKSLKEFATPFLSEDLALEASSPSNKHKQPTLRPSPRKKYREPEEDQSLIQQQKQLEQESQVDWKAKYYELLKENEILKLATSVKKID